MTAAMLCRNMLRSLASLYYRSGRSGSRVCALVMTGNRIKRHPRPTTKLSPADFLKLSALGDSSPVPDTDESCLRPQAC